MRQPGQEFRAERFTIDRKSIEKTASGTIKFRGRLTKTGVFEYQRGDSVVRELRSPEEVFAPSVLDSLEGCHVTVDHPTDFVDGDNWRVHSVGTVLNAKVNPPYIEGTLSVHDSKTQHLIEHGYLKEVSCGYFMTPVPVQDGTADYSQTQIRMNHAALGPEGWGRLGSDVSLTLDSKGDQILFPIGVDVMKEPTQTVDATVSEQERLPGIEVDHPGARFDSIEKSLAELSGLVGRLVSAQTKDKKPYKEIEEKPTEDSLREATRRGIEEGVKLEWRARAAHKAVFPTRDTSDTPHLCADQLCKEVLDLEINDSRYTLEELVDRAEVSAARARAIAEETKKREDAKLMRAAYGFPPRDTSVDPLAEYILGAK